MATPEVNRICRAYGAGGIRFYLVHADAELSVAEAAKHAAEYGYSSPVLMDRKHELVETLGVTTTPEVAVVTRDGAIAYRGRIDDRYAALGKPAL